MSNEPVTVRLPKPMQNEDAEVFVGENGKGYRIRKGVNVAIPAYVAEVLRNSELALDRVDAFVEARSEKTATA